MIFTAPLEMTACSQHDPCQVSRGAHSHSNDQLTQPRSLHLLEFHCRDRLFRLRPCWICLGLNALFGTMWQGTQYSKDQSYHFHQPLFYQLLTPFVYSKAKHINLCCHPPCRYQSTCKINFNNISVKIRKVRPIKPKKKVKIQGVWWMCVTVW